MSEPQVYTFKELDKFQLYTPTPNTPGKNSAMRFSSYRGNPRISVFTNVAGDTGKGIINAAMNPETFFIFLDLLEGIAKNKSPDKYKIDCSTLIRNNETGERATERTLSAELYFGRDDHGIVWISVTAPDRPRIKFEFRVSNFHKIFKGDGTAINETEASSYQALAFVTAIRSVYSTHIGELRAPYAGGVAKTEGSSAPAKKPVVGSNSFDDVTF